MWGEDGRGGQALKPEPGVVGGEDADARNMSLGEGVGPPIGVSLPDEDLVDLRAFIRGSLPLPHPSQARGGGALQPDPTPDPSPSSNPAPPPPTPASSANLDQLLGMGDPFLGAPVGGTTLARAGSRGVLGASPLGGTPSYIAAGMRQGFARGAAQGLPRAPAAPPLQRPPASGGAQGSGPGQGAAGGVRQRSAELHRPAQGSGQGRGAGQLGPELDPDPGLNPLGEPGHARGELTAAAAGLLQATRGPSAQARPGARSAGAVVDSAALRRVRAPASALCRARGRGLGLPITWFSTATGGERAESPLTICHARVNTIKWRVQACLHHCCPYLVLCILWVYCRCTQSKALCSGHR